MRPLRDHTFDVKTTVGHVAGVNSDVGVGREAVAADHVSGRVAAKVGRVFGAALGEIFIFHDFPVNLMRIHKKS
jgi:hypothetical protein